MEGGLQKDTLTQTHRGSGFDKRKLNKDGCLPTSNDCLFKVKGSKQALFIERSVRSQIACSGGAVAPPSDFCL